MSRTITAGGVSLELEERGEGWPLPFLHPGEGLEPQREWLDLLAHRYHVQLSRLRRRAPPVGFHGADPRRHT